MTKIGIPFNFYKPDGYEKCDLVYDFPVTGEKNKYLQNGDLMISAIFEKLRDEEIIGLINDGDMLLVPALETDLTRPMNIIKLSITGDNYTLVPISEYVDRKIIILRKEDINSNTITGKVLMSFRDFGNVIEK